MSKENALKISESYIVGIDISEDKDLSVRMVRPP